MKIVLCDRTPEIVEALATAFQGEDGVIVRRGDVLRTGCRAVVSPGNSFGDMGGGLDKHIDDYSKGHAQRIVVARFGNVSLERCRWAPPWSWR